MLAKGAQSLPNKAAHDYKQLAKHYDSKNYKKGMKNAQKILESYPDHPQTNSMKALFELELGEEAKAEVTAKFALLKSMMKSMFCWHTYGTVLKRRKNYVQAAKCFEQALKFQKDNMQLLRQTAALQVQVRDHAGHVATRWKILQQKPNLLYNWAAYAVAQHLKGDFEQLYKALSSIENMRLSMDMKPIQISQYLIYRVIAYRDGEKYDKMYEQLLKHKSKIMDEDIWHELMFKCCCKLNKNEQAAKSIEFLIKKYPENNEYIRKYQKFTQLSPRELYKKLMTEFNSKISKVYELTVIEDKNQFKNLFSEFIKNYYQKNLISLFAQIQIVYQKSPFVSVIEEVFLEFQASLKENKYPDGSQAAFPTQYLWSLYLLAQHYSLRFETLKLAHDYIVKAITHTNTVSQFYTVKAEIEYKMHNNLESLKTINQARKTDLADRFMNNICIKYLMRMMKPKIAQDILKLFMRDQLSLYQLQNQWYIIEAGKSFLKMRKFAPGLRHLNFIEKQFQDMESNQYDFHTYCVRKWTLREYIEFIAFNDNLYHDKKYAEAAYLAIQNLFQYIQYLKNEVKQKIEEPKEEEEKKPKKKKNKKNKAPETQEIPPVENFRKKIDYDGVEYSQKIKNDPLAEALIYAKNITSAKYYNKGNQKQNKLYAKAFSQSIRTFIHFNKPLLVIKAHKKLLLTKHNPYLTHYWSIKTIKYLEKVLADEKAHEIIRENIKQYLKEIMAEQNLTQYHLKVTDSLPENPLQTILSKQLQLALHQKDTRQELIKLYSNELQCIIKQADKKVNTLKLVFYIVHKLEFYGQFTQHQKQALNQQFGEQTTYFTNWLQQIDKLPDSTWSLFWLSDYDIQRQEELMKKAEQKKKEEHNKQKKQ